MSADPAPPVKLSLRQRLGHNIFRSRSHASSPTRSSLSTLALTPSTGQPLGSSLSPPSAEPVATRSSSQQATSNSSTSYNLLDEALKRLSDHDRATLQNHILPNSSDIDLALKQALAAAQEKRRCCDEKRWTFTFAGRAVTLKEEADKVVRWLDRFKAVGDVAANANPVHAGLPWTGIRLLLEVRILSHKLKPTDLTFQSTGYRI
jgi:hypothetical protein